MSARLWAWLARVCERRTRAIARACGVEPDAALLERLADEQLRRVWAHAMTGTVVATLFGIGLAQHLKGALDPTWINYWMALKLAVAVPRLLQTHAYLQAGRGGGRGRRQLTYLALAADGLVWGLGGLFAVSGSTATASLVAACMVCVACVATFGLQVRTAATATYVVPIVGLTALGLLLRGDELGIFGGSGLLALLVVLLATALKSDRLLAEGFFVRERAERHARERAEALALAERSAQERSEALVHAQRESAAKSQFLATMSHELRTPLHGILGVCRLLKEELRDPSVTKRLGLIESSGDHLLGLINDVLDISRIEANHLVLQTAEIDLSEETERLAAVYAARCQDKRLSFHAEIDLPPGYVVVADSSRLRQVLHNLLGNAVKFTDTGHVTLTVRRPEPGQIVFEVRDSGVGIPAEAQARIFDKFSQVETPGRNPLEGTGLGLTIARELARAMGGDITVVSARGVGSCFRFSVPLRACAVALAQPSGAEVVSFDAARRQAAPGGRALLAEDNDVNALVASAYLSRQGLRVDRADNGRDAVRQACGPNRPDIVLMDVRMPELDGLGATRAIRTYEHLHGLPPVPIIALTATTSSNELRLCMEAGMDDTLSKPFTGPQLTELLAKWLRLGASAAVAV